MKSQGRVETTMAVTSLSSKRGWDPGCRITAGDPPCGRAQGGGRHEAHSESSRGWAGLLSWDRGLSAGGSRSQPRAEVAAVMGRVEEER